MEQTINTIRSLIDQKAWRLLKADLKKSDDVKLAQVVEQLSTPEGLIIFRLLSRRRIKELFPILAFEHQERILEGLQQYESKLIQLLNDLAPDDRTALFATLPTRITQRLLHYLTPYERKIALQLLSYPEASIGRLMTTEFIAVLATSTVEQTFAQIRQFGRDSETLETIFVLDKHFKLLDDLPIRDLIFAEPQQVVSELLDGHFAILDPFADKESAVKAFKDYDRVALPVVDTTGILIGIITIDDIMDVAEEESTEDFHKFGAFQTAITSPLKAGIGSLYKNRIFWLFTLVFMNVFSGAALAVFEDVIQSVVSLVFFLPLLIGSGGNAGSQSATLMIRSLAVGDVKVSDWYKLIGKEVLVSFLLGFTMALGVAVVASFRSPEIILVVSITMVLTVMVGSLIGMLLPFIFTKFKRDPATASAPLITSIADICGVVIYFTVAQKILLTI